ncbi:hypothetical protein GYH30_024530 [Glycine max]|uniref:No apical meristem-associated C-terminal domain-containing protein n=2 Tax=Glycine subgen. Soja TaxID=1462606 RepID=A0A0R0IF55_SOYBN|nr:hypothetical protein GYH30_024530 [Glycine max]RZB91341.1 hypothetical protein D0Y65_023660 [Glycine soja]
MAQCLKQSNRRHGQKRTRGLTQLRGRWNIICNVVPKFVGCYTHVVQRRKSKSSNEDIKDFLFGVYSSSSNSETPTSYAHDSTTSTVHPIGKKSTKRKNKEKHAKSSTKDAQFIALQQQHKERMSKMDELVKARNEQNKVEEMKIIQLKDHEMLCNMIREKYNTS